jgi:hypothetical protein
MMTRLGRTISGKRCGIGAAAGAVFARWGTGPLEGRVRCFTRNLVEC